VLSETGHRAWRALSHRILRRRKSPANEGDKLEISYALTYPTAQLVSSLQLFDQQSFRQAALNYR
jgi:hypothetical protein